MDHGHTTTRRERRLPVRLPWGRRRALLELPSHTVELLAHIVHDRRLRLALEDELRIRLEGDRCPCGCCQAATA